jgi:hypothetical protein
MKRVDYENSMSIELAGCGYSNIMEKRVQAQYDNGTSRFRVTSIEISWCDHSKTIKRAGYEHSKSTEREGCGHSTSKERAGCQYSKRMERKGCKDNTSMEPAGCEYSKSMEKGGCKHITRIERVDLE